MVFVVDDTYMMVSSIVRGPDLERNVSDNKVSLSFRFQSGPYALFLRVYFINGMRCEVDD